MSIFRRKPAAAAVAVAQPPVSVPGLFVLPEGTTKNDFRDGYEGTIYNPNGGCPECHGGGLVPKDGDGNQTLCNCTKGDLQMLTQSETDQKAAAV